MHPTPNQSTLPVTHKHMHTQLHQSYTKQEVYSSLHPPAKGPYSSRLLPPFKPCPVLHEGLPFCNGLPSSDPVLHEGLPFCNGLPSSDPVLQRSPVIQWQNKEYTFLLCKSRGGGGGSFLLCKSGGVFTFMQVCRAPPHPPNPFFCPCCQLRTQHHNSYPNEEMYSSLCTPEKSCPPRKSAIQGSPPIQWSPVIHWHNTEHLWIMEMPFNCT